MSAKLGEYTLSALEEMAVVSEKDGCRISIVKDAVDNRLFSLKETAEIAVQLCDALEILHTAIPPIIHRDINPSNVMVTIKGTVKLFDKIK